MRRQPCSHDGRYTNAILTDTGYDKVVAAAPGHVAIARALVIDALTESELTQLRSIADRIHSRIDPDRRCPSTG